jgi:hypothetical protein
MAIHMARTQNGESAFPILDYGGGVLSVNMDGNAKTMGPFTGADGVRVHARGTGPFFVRVDGVAPTVDDPLAVQYDQGEKDWVMFPASGGSIEVVGAPGAGKFHAIPIVSVRPY